MASLSLYWHFLTPRPHQVVPEGDKTCLLGTGSHGIQAGLGLII